MSDEIESLLLNPPNEDIRYFATRKHHPRWTKAIAAKPVADGQRTLKIIESSQREGQVDMSSGLIEHTDLLLSQTSRLRRPTLVQPKLARAVQQQGAILRLRFEQSKAQPKANGLLRRSPTQPSSQQPGC